MRFIYMNIIFVSEIAALLGLNPWECYKKYQNKLSKLNYNRTPIKYYYENIEFPEIETKLIPTRLPILYENNNTSIRDNCKFGNLNEITIIQHLNTSKYSIDNQQKLYKYQLDNCMLVGRIDGMRNYKSKTKIPIEIKSRVNKFHGVKPHENLQLQLYMLMCDVDEIQFIECYNNELRRYLVKKNTDFINIILQHIIKLVAVN
jgi:hypothetical protein